MSSNPESPKSDPSMRPTSVSVLIVAALAAAAVGWLMLSIFKYSLVPLLPWSPVIVLAGLAAVEGVLAQNTSARIQRKPGTARVDPLAVARYVALAKASAVVGALWAGYSGSLLTWLVTETTQEAQDDRPVAIAGKRPQIAHANLHHACLARAAHHPVLKDPRKKLRKDRQNLKSHLPLSA